MEEDTYHTIVIGAGAGGLVVAKGLADAGKKVLLVEKGAFGGDCTNSGCIPSKALIASANTAHELWRSGLYGLDMSIVSFQASRALDRVREIVKGFREKNSPEGLKAMGVDARKGTCSFIDPYTVQIQAASGQVSKISSKNIVIATGSSPLIPAIKGLQDVPYHTSQTIFDIQGIPNSLAIIGGGQIGSEFAQSFRRLGSSVILIEQQSHIIGREEPEAYRAIQSGLSKEGVEIFLEVDVMRVRREGDKIFLNLRRRTDEKEWEVCVNLLLITAGRRPNVSELNLEVANVAFSPEGIVTDKYGRTSQSHIWAVGDATGRSFFPHAAENQARTVLANLILPWPFKVKLDLDQPIPRVTFTDPEVASLGLTEKAAIELYGQKNIATYLVPLSESDRAICQDRKDGFVKVITKKYTSKILGATIVAPIGADMLVEISCAMRFNIPLRKLSSLIHPYPTYSQIIRKAADEWLLKTILPLFCKHRNLPK
jgi:pyruvate/2-oxoglutarate dehydrogenase complex dihydrolipoamide dehydrogenase (E3) component